MGLIGSVVSGLGMNALEGAAQELGQAGGAIEQAVSSLLGGGQEQPGGVGEQQGGGQSIEQQLSQTLAQLSQELQQMGGGQQGGGGAMPQAGGPEQSAGGGAGTGTGATGFSGNEAAALPDLQNLLVDSAGNGGAGYASHVGGDLNRLRGEVQDAMKNGQMSEQQGAKTLEDIGASNVQAVEQDLTGTSGNVTQPAQANADSPTSFSQALSNL